MTVRTEGGRPWAGVRYFLQYGKEIVDIPDNAADAMMACDRNPGMVVMAEVYDLSNQYVEKVEPRRQVYPIKGVLTDFPF